MGRVLLSAFHYLLIVVAIVFIAMKVSIVVHHVRSNASFATGDYLDLLQATVLLIAALGSARFLMKERKSRSSSES